MPRKVRDKDLGDRTARERLAIQGKPHWRALQQGLHIGYRRLRAKSGTWTARFYNRDDGYTYDVIGTADDKTDADGVTVFSFDQAVDKARKLHTDRANKAAGNYGPLTISDVMQAYVTKLDHDGKHTANVEGHISKYIAPLIGKIEIAKLTDEKLNAWKADIAKMPARHRKAHDPIARKASANRTLSVLKSGLNNAYKAGKIESDKAWRSVEPFKGVTRRRERFLTVAEGKRLSNAAEPDFRMMIQAGLQTGCRYAELCNLKVGDFRPDSQTLSIQKSKSGRSRNVYLTDEGVALFEDLAAGRKSTDVLIRREDGLAFSTSHQIRRMQTACENARIDPPVSFHILRHSYASALVKAGVPLAYVAQSLGHTSIKMVEQHYGHIAKSHLAETIRENVPSYGFTKSSITTIKR